MSVQNLKSKNFQKGDKRMNKQKNKKINNHFSRFAVMAILLCMVTTIIIAVRSAVPVLASNTIYNYVENGITYGYLRMDESGNYTETGEYADLFRVILPENYGTEIVIPEKLGNVPVKRISTMMEVWRWTSEYYYDGEQKRVKAKDITKITIPTGIDDVYGFSSELKKSLEQIVVSGTGTFEFGSSGGGSYKALKSIVATDGAIVKFDDGSFHDSPLLTKVSCYIEEVGAQAFANSGITDITIANPGGTVLIKSRAFAYNDTAKISNVKFDADEVILYDDCFYKTSITELANPSGELTFAASEGESYHGPFGSTEANLTLTKISAKDGVNISAALGQSSWGQLKALETVENVKSLCAYALSYCPNLKNVTFIHGADIKEMPEGVFYECTSLESIELPNTITKIDRNAFSWSGIVDIVVPDTVTELSAYTFAYCTNLKKISMPVVGFGDNYFTGSTALNEIHFTSGRMSYYSLSRLGLTNFVNIYIDDGVEYVYLPDYEIDEVKFNYKIYSNRNKLSEQNCENFKEYEYTRTLKDGEKLSGRYVYKVYSTNDVGIVEYLYNSKETRIDIPQYIDGHRVSFICDNAFSKCYNVEEITIPNSVEGFGKNAFKNCTKLKKMELPTLWAYSISEGIYSTAAMTRIEIPGNVHYVFYNAISDCSNLEEIVFKEGVNSIDCNFSNCGLLKRIYIPKSVEELYGGTTSSDRTYYVYKDSYALQYMQKNGLKYVIVDADDSGNTGDAGGDNPGGNSGNTGDNRGENLSSYYNITVNGGTWDGTHYYLPSGTMVYNAFFSDGTYTYYLQADGTPMKDRLTYHPDGVHVIYFDADGHEVFSDFAHISKSIAGTDVDDMCFFNVYGYMYVDTLTYDKTGTKLYYVNPYGVLERNGWFQFSGHEFDAGLGFSGKAGGYGYANWDCSLMVNTNTYDWNGNLVYMQGDGHMAQ